MTRHSQTHESRRKKHCPRERSYQHHAANHVLHRETCCLHGRMQLWIWCRGRRVGSIAARPKAQCIHPIAELPKTPSGARVGYQTNIFKGWHKTGGQRCIAFPVVSSNTKTGCTTFTSFDLLYDPHPFQSDG